MNKQKFTLAIFCIQLVGCASGWYKPNTAQTEHDTDLAYCERLADQSQQPRARYEASTTGWVTTSGNHVNYMPPVISKVDANANNRRSARDLCMQTRGYEYKMQPGMVPGSSLLDKPQ